EQKLKELREKAAVQLDQLQVEFEKKAKSIREGTTKEFDILTYTLPEVGMKAIGGLINGMEDMRGPLEEKAKELANLVNSTMGIQVATSSSLTQVPQAARQIKNAADAISSNSTTFTVKNVVETPKLEEKLDKLLTSFDKAASKSNEPSVVMYQTNNSPQPLLPSETARLNRQALEQMAFRMR
ncbi:hypothetical protein, partial [Bacillus manliponensis]